MAGSPVVAGRRDGVGGIVECVNNVESLAAPVSEIGHDKPANRLEQPNTARSRDYETKVNAWRAQHEALCAPAYRITLVDRDPDRIKKHGRMGLGYVLGKKTGHDIKTPAEVEASISTLRRENSRLFDIYITPIDEHNHYILVDDIHEEKAGKLTKFRSDGFQFALIQFSSNDNYQAILKVPKIDGDHDFANQVFQKLNTDYGEPGIKGGVVHPFRMAGYANKKQGKSGFTQLIDKNPAATCEKTSEFIRFAMENHDAERQAKEVEKEKILRLKAIGNHNQMPLNPGSNDAVLRAYQKSFNRTLGLAKKQGWNIDYSRIDFAAAKDLIKQGYRSELIEKAIAEGSPSIEQRKGQHIDDYARLTVQKAMVSSDVLQHKAKAEAQQAQRSGPRL
ncbi:MAG: DNA-primase RepB domain-containing protein [Methylobacter sp.]